MRKSLRPWVIAATLAAGSCVVALLLGELVLAVAGLDWTASMMTNDRELGWSLRPGARGWFLEEGKAYVEINRDGMRDVDRVVEKAPSVVRVAVLGDSTTESRQVSMDRVWTMLLEDHLERCPKLAHRRVEVLNFGVGGYGTAQELLMLQTRAMKYSPDVVLLAFYPGNDLFNNVRELNPTNPSSTPYYVLGPAGDLVLDESFRGTPELDPAYIAKKNLLGEMLNTSRLLRGLYRAYTVAGRPPMEISLDQQAQLFYYPPGHPDSHPAMQTAWRVTEAMLLRFRDSVETRGMEAWLTTMTVAAQVQPEREARLGVQGRLGLDALDYPNRRIAAFAKANDIRYIEQLDPLLEHAAGMGAPLHGFEVNGRLNDGHLNERGHEAVAEVLSEHLCKEGFLNLPPIATASTN